MELSYALMSRGGFDVAVCLHTASPVPRLEWDALVQQLQTLAKDTQTASQRVRMLVVTDGGAPDARQRSQLGQLFRGRPIVTAVVVPGMSQPLKRGLMTALTWFNPSMAFFVPSQLEAALRHIGLERERSALWTTLTELQRKLPAVRTLALLAESTGLPLVDTAVRRVL